MESTQEQLRRFVESARKVLVDVDLDAFVIKRQDFIFRVAPPKCGDDGSSKRRRTTPRQVGAASSSWASS
jgi:hypothetical protein